MSKCFEFRDAFPPIEDAIEELCQRDGEAKHDAVVEELIKHKQGSLVVEDAVTRCLEHGKKLMASIMVQWFSQQYPRHRLKGFEARFKRRQIDESWAYSRR
jgi:hypothetical protein